MLTLGARVTHAITASKIDRVVLVERVGISRPYLSQIENNVRKPGRDTLIAIARETGFPIGFFTDEDIQARQVDKYLVFAKEIDEAIDAGAKEEEIREAIRLIIKLKTRAD